MKEKRITKSINECKSEKETFDFHSLLIFRNPMAPNPSTEPFDSGNCKIFFGNRK